ncbi:hypothetical protein M0805_008826 [Coniferiporia weirii]|nr:hypothetical protein M0805_008826 [Coniferiporia weirii]
MSARPSLTPVAAPSDTDIFSISDAHLAQRYQFIREIGAGNWGCVWLCSPKTTESVQARTDDACRNVAVKLVFREKKPTTAQRVRSLWNEMKIVRALKQDPHPSIIPFHSFIITPSFAIITMEYLPHLVPVEVPEYKAREWFRSLLSAVSFIHARGVVHNDIKPANILLSTKKVPVLVDFGFAERYETGSKRAFLSNLAYGTPEYLSPERARGNVHDTRKSDMWSLGITFFEILVGRTPFEYIEGEKFTTPEDLERYWSRTVKGRWVGEWKMSRSAERMLRTLITPNVDMRCSASDAMKDSYWADETDSEISLDALSSPVPSRSSIRVKKPESKPLTPLAKENMKPRTPERPVLANDKQARVNTRTARRTHLHVLPPIEGSPLSSRIASAKENVSPSTRSPPRMHAVKARAPVTRKPVPRFEVENGSPLVSRGEAARQKETKERNKGRVLADSTSRSRNVETPKKAPTTCAREKVEKVKQADATKRLGSGSYDRVKAFERLKQLERSRFLEEEDQESQEEELEQGRSQALEQVLSPKLSSACMRTPSTAGLSTKVDEKSVVEMNFERPATADSSYTLLSDFKGGLGRRISVDEKSTEDPKLFASQTRHRAGTSDSSLTLFKQSIRVSMEKGLRLYKSSTLGRTSIRKASRQASEDLDQSLGVTHRESWENDTLIRNAKTSIPLVQNVLRSEQVAADDKVDRLSLWVRNVEQVVREAKENFASSSVTPLPPLPARPVSRPVASRPSRGSRKILAVDKIFPADISSPIIPAQEVSSKNAQGGPSSILPPSSKELSRADPASPDRSRRATISVSPGRAKKIMPMTSFDKSPSKRKEKAKSSGNLICMVRPISPLSQLEKELERGEDVSIPNLSEVLDRSIFIARTGSTPPLDNASVAPGKSSVIRQQVQDRVSSTLGPSKPPPSSALRESSSSPVLGTPQRRHIEGVYDRFLMAATGVKRVGRGYQSDMSAPAQQNPPTSVQKKNSKLFGRSARAVTPLIPGDDLGKSGTSDDFGFMSVSYSASASFRDDANKSVSAVRKAFKAIVTGKSVARRQSKVF